jgi:vacuolar-type H+-ATPase catalytic subunit A/Vma1
VRIPRPFEDVKQPDRPIITGMRYLDLLFPVEIGGTCAICDWGMTTKELICIMNWKLIQTANPDCTVCLMNGSGNDLSFVELEELDTAFGSQRVPTTMKTIGVTARGNMTLASCENSLYITMTIAEYLRDMGYNVSLIADSITRWVEALVEKSGIGMCLRLLTR